MNKREKERIRHMQFDAWKIFETEKWSNEKPLATMR